MDYDLVAVSVGETHWLLLKHVLLFDSLLELFRHMYSHVNVHCLSQKVNTSEYIFIKETLGTHIVQFADVDVLKERCDLILTFMRTFKHIGECNAEFKLAECVRKCVHIFYFPHLGVSFVSEKGLHICQFYGDFLYVEKVDMEFGDLARKFFQGKKWENKDALCRKVEAFKILFCI